MTAWDRARDAFGAGMTEVDERFQEPLFREAVALLRRADATAETTAQADDIQWLLDSHDPRNSEAYLTVARRVNDRFLGRE